MDKLKSRYWVCANLIGIGLYLYFASATWLPPSDPTIGLLSGEPIYWSLTALPVLAICLVINLIWLGLIVLNARRGSGWRSIRNWLLVIISWVLVNRFDGYNIEHGSRFSREIVAQPSVQTHPEK